ncbi:MAG: magnesium chelatase, partial [Mogibacterium sp.]|nr:magnesium chelatase [Mogibacterium sp.]
MISIVNTGVCRGIEGRLVKAETDLANGIPSMNIVGLASATVQESKERIKAAIINSGYEFPRGRITVNLAPAELKKNGSCLDLPIAVGVLATELCVNA